jgi:hypothetical protein
MGGGESKDLIGGGDNPRGGIGCGGPRDGGGLGVWVEEDMLDRSDRELY